jgi:Bax protein
MLRIIRDLILIALFIFAIYLFAKTQKYNSRYWPKEIKITDIGLTNIDSVLVQNDTALVPVNYVGSIDFRDVNPEKRKDLFIQFLLPAIVITRERLMDDLHHVEFLEERVSKKKKIAKVDSIFLDGMKMKYETDSLKELKKRIYPHPVSMALAQAILESGWGTSGIFRKGNNIFGIMSFSSDDSRYKIRFPDSNVKRYIRTYDSIIASVEDYYLLISKVSSYKKFRQKRWNGAPSDELFRYINSYHESDQYINMAHSIIDSNNLKHYDNIPISPKHLKYNTLFSFLTQLP